MHAGQHLRNTVLGYIRKDGKTLMMHKINKPKDDVHYGHWGGLGGHIDPGESPEEAVVREAHEESGLTVKNPRLRGVMTFTGFWPDKRDEYVFAFEITEFDGELIKENEEGVLEWVPNDEVTQRTEWPADDIFVPWLDQDKFFSAKFVYQDGELIDHTVVFY